MEKADGNDGIHLSIRMGVYLLEAMTPDALGNQTYNQNYIVCESHKKQTK